MNIFWVALVLSQWFLAFQAQFKCVIRKPLGIQVGLGTHEVGIWFFSHYVKIINSVYLIEASLVAQSVKNLPMMQETWVQSLGWEDPLEKEMATHASILAWEIPWTEEPGGLQSMGL